MEQQEKKWYVVRAISGKEKKAKEYIESEMAKRGWSNDVPTVLIPTEQVVSIRNGKKVVKDRNYFPGYVIIEANLRDEIIPVIQNIPNVLDFLANAKVNLSPCVSRKSTASSARWMSRWMASTLWTVSLWANPSRSSMARSTASRALSKR